MVGKERIFSVLSTRADFYMRPSTASCAKKSEMFRHILFWLLNTLDNQRLVKLHRKLFVLQPLIYKALSLSGKVSEEGRKYEAEEGDHGGINIERAKAVMKAEDKFDKETERRRHKELRQVCLRTHFFLVL